MQVGGLSSKIQINNDRLGTWIKACRTEDLNNSSLLYFDYEKKKILLVKVCNRIYATDRICTHAYADLSTGFLNETEKTITCPLYMSNFCLENGMPQNLPAGEPLKTYNI
ncbi:MAG TPA: Rieske 2Fe-2S domain-containing protein [Nitrososphaeraceae archaeon]|nr:Rieske 2Fe-2S domain-containing protein [Nitrososphaeraceae archaeon]